MGGLIKQNGHPVTPDGIWIEFEVEYSVVKEDDYGEEARFKVNLIPVVGRPIKKSIFGGN
jgi:hypothetical protein